MIYQHKQYAFAILAILAWVLSFTLLAVYFIGAITGLMLFALFLVLMAVLFHGLTVCVDTQSVTFGFAFGWFGDRISLKNIESVTAVTNSWRHGIGMRITNDGWVYSASGFAAVEIKLKDGTAYRIGTNDQLALVDAIESEINKQ